MLVQAGVGAESTGRVPKLEFAVVSLSSYGLTVRTDGYDVHVAAVALLLHREGLALPLSHQRLVQLRASQGDLVTGVVQRYEGYVLATYIMKCR